MSYQIAGVDTYMRDRVGSGSGIFWTVKDRNDSAKMVSWVCVPASCAVA